ncbi:hypothetical protein Tco_0763798 [Tanacetum coccineum]
MPASWFFDLYHLYDCLLLKTVPIAAATCLKKLKKEKEDNLLKINNYDNATKSLDKVIGSQLVDNNKKGLGYNVVPPSPTGLFAPPSIDLSHSGNEKFKEPEFVGYGVKVDKSVCEKSSKEIKKTPGAPIIEDWVSDDEEQDESKPKSEKKTVIPTAAKIEFVRPKQQEKPIRKPVKYAEMYRSQKPRGNQRNWDNQKKTVNAAKPKAAYNAVKRNRFNIVKASACWVWMPKNRVVDHVSKNISASVTLKRLDYIDAQDMKNAHINEDHFCSDGCTGLGEAKVQKRKRRIQRRVQQKQKDQEDEVFGRILSAKKMKV